MLKLGYSMAHDFKEDISKEKLDGMVTRLQTVSKKYSQLEAERKKMYSKMMAAKVYVRMLF